MCHPLNTLRFFGMVRTKATDTDGYTDGTSEVVVVHLEPHGILRIWRDSSVNITGMELEVDLRGILYAPKVTVTPWDSCAPKCFPSTESATDYSCVKFCQPTPDGITEDECIAGTACCCSMAKRVVCSANDAGTTSCAQYKSLVAQTLSGDTCAKICARQLGAF